MAEARGLTVSRTPDATLVIHLAGRWRLAEGLPPATPVERELGTAPAPRRVTFDAAALGEWDSSAVTFLARVLDLCRARNVPADRAGLPAGLQRLLGLAE